MRLRRGIQSKRRQAKVAPPVAYQRAPRRAGAARVLTPGAVVMTVRVTVEGFAPLRVTMDEGEMLKVGGWRAPDGPEATVAVS